MSSRRLLLGYIILSKALVFSVILPSFVGNRYANFIVLILILLAGILSSRVSLNNFSIITIFTSFFLYSINQGALNFLVPLLPFLGLLFLIKPFASDRYNWLAMIASSVAIIATNIFSHYSTDQLGTNYINLQSQVYLHIILLNLIYFRKPFVIPVFLAVANSILFNPGLIGNRSAIFLLFFLLTKDHIKKLVNLVRSNKVYGILVLFLLSIISYMFIDKIIDNPKWGGEYHELRFMWALQVLEYLRINGLNALWDNAELILPTINPHNSFLYLLMYEAYVGIFKLLIFALSIFIVPSSAFLAIFLRASFDSFFLVGPSGLIFFILIRSYKKYGK